MPRKVLGEWKTEYLQILDPEGNMDESLDPHLSRALLESIYYHMLLARAFDETAVALQREGRLLTYGPLRGQEAAQVPVALAMEAGDWLLPSFREHGAIMARGVSPKMLFQYWGGDERGHGYPKDVNILPVAVPVASQIPHGVGIAWALKLRKERACAVVFFGDGATSKADFHEGLNFAGVLRTPNVFVCQNNQWAISVPRSKQTASETLAQKAIAYGFEGIQVDGNDPIGMYVAAKQAVDKARAGGGPTLIEAFTYRMGDHTTADDATRYRGREEVEEWAKKDPIERLRKYLTKIEALDREKDLQLRQRAAEAVAKAVKDYEAEPPQAIQDMFGFTFADMPPHLKEQWEYAWRLEQERRKAGQGK